MFEAIVPGDRVAIVASSSDAGARFPAIFQLGLKRLREHFGLEPVVYPSAQILTPSLAARAADLHSAFSDPSIKAVISSIGGEEQIRLIKYLDPALFKAHPKPFFGYCDNTHFANFLFRLGIPSFYGSSLMVQFAMPGAMFQASIASIKWALAGAKELFSVAAAPEFSEVDLPWDDPETPSGFKMREQNTAGLIFCGEAKVRAKLWGGCTESLDYLLKVPGHRPRLEQIEGSILFLESSEQLPEPAQLYRLLISLGEWGYLEGAQGLVVARPKAWDFAKPLRPEQRKAYRIDQQEALSRGFRLYNKQAPMVFNVDFGHTDPQLVVPYGGYACIESTEESKSLAWQLA